MTDRDQLRVLQKRALVLRAELERAQWAENLHDFKQGAGLDRPGSFLSMATLARAACALVSCRKSFPWAIHILRGPFMNLVTGLFSARWLNQQSTRRQWLFKGLKWGVGSLALWQLWQLWRWGTQQRKNHPD